MKKFTLLLWIAGWSTCFGQIDWASVPMVTIGDSSASKQPMLVLTGTVRTGSGSPVPGATLSLDVLKYFDYSDASGKYLINCPPGKYRLIVRHIGMLPFYQQVDLRSTGVLDIIIEEGVVDLEEIVVSARAKDANVKETISGVTRLSLPEIKTLPTLMGEVDIVKNLQMLPGVNSTGEGSSAYNVRGGRNDQNLVLVNGAPLFNASHALGFVSGFNQDVLGTFTFYKGSVPAQFGGRAASVLDVRFRPGNSDSWKYQAGIGMISSRFTAEGPLVKGRTHLITGIRFSQANWLRGLVKDPDVRNSTVGFADGSAVLSHRFNPNSNINLTFYASHDDFRFSRQFGFNWQNLLASAAWRSFANRKASPLLTLSWGQYRNALIDPSGFDQSVLKNNLRYLRVEETVQYSPGERQSITAGIEATAYLPDAERREPYGKNQTVRPSSVRKDRGAEASVYVQDDINLHENFSVSAGLRFSTYAQIGPDSTFMYQQGVAKSVRTIIDTTVWRGLSTDAAYGLLQPRLSFRWVPCPDQAVKGGYHRMGQYLHQISNTATPSPVDTWQVATPYLAPQRSDNFSLGYFRNFKDHLFETSLEFFYKSMVNLAEYKDFPDLLQNNHLETELLRAKGRSQGVELFFNKRKGWWTGWVSYTYTQSQLRVASPVAGESINGGAWYPAGYNRPHHVNLVINRRMNHGSAFSAVVVFNSGRPLTAVETSYINFGTVVPVYSDRNQYRIGNYFRIDLSLTIGRVFRKLDDNLVISLYNLTGRENPYSVFYKRVRTDYFIPSAYQLAVIGAVIPSVTYNINLR